MAADPKTQTDNYIVPLGTDIGHIHLRVSNVERSLAFYSGVLGFELTQRMGDSAAFISAGGYHHHIGLNVWESEDGTPPPAGHTGLYHFAIRYASDHDFAVAVKRVVEHGVQLQGLVDHGVSWAAYLADPDGNGIELMFDLPREEWPRDEDGSLHMISRRLPWEVVLEHAEEQH